MVAESVQDLARLRSRVFAVVDRDDPRIARAIEHAATANDDVVGGRRRRLRANLSVRTRGEDECGEHATNWVVVLQHLLLGGSTVYNIGIPDRPQAYCAPGSGALFLGAGHDPWPHQLEEICTKPCSIETFAGSAYSFS